MNIIEHAEQAHTEYEWLTERNLVDKWFIYLKEWCAARNVMETLEFSGELSLGDVVRMIQDYIDENYGIKLYPNVYISAVPIEEFYPNVIENYPKDIAVFDGGSWYMSELLECGEYLNGTLRI